MGRNTPKKKAARPAGKARSSRKSSISAAPADFVEAFYSHVMKADMALFSAKDRAAMAASVWNLAQQRKPRSLKLRLFNPSPVADGWTVDHTVLEIINDDMPFLVDSVTGALQRRGLTVHLVIHPVLQVRRDSQGNLLNLVDRKGKSPAGSGPVGSVQPESFMHIQLDHCLDPAFLKEIEEEIHAVLSDVRAAVEDWPQMRKRMQEAMAQAAASKQQKEAAAHTEEARAFMRWLDDNNFTYLGYRDIDLVQKNGKLESIRVLKNSGLGVLRDPEVRMFGGLRALNAEKTPTLQRYVHQHNLLVITKTNGRSRVHRPVPMDAIFIRRFDAKGNIVGERLFVGLFTSQSYSQVPRDIPFLRRKIDYALKKAAFSPSGHAGKALAHILNNYPHDELFQISEDDLLRNSLGILQLQERAHVALFVRRDPFERFVTCLVYVPRDRYDSALRLKFQDVLEKAFDGKADDWNVRLDDSLLARAFITLLLKPNAPHPDPEKLEAELRDLCRNWSDRLRDRLVKEYGEAAALALLRRYGEAFPIAYRDVVRPLVAVHDIQSLERCRKAGGALVVDLSPGPSNDLLHLKLFRPEQPIALSEVLPLIEGMGLRIEYTGGPYEVTPRGDAKPVFVHEFVGRPGHPSVSDFRHVKPLFEDAFGKLWAGEIENDIFNALVLRAGMPWREIVMMRCFARYLRQLRIPYSHEMIGDTFMAHPHITQKLYALFFARHNPDLKGDRTARCRALEAEIHDALGNVHVLEEDRIIRRYLNLAQASLRTNFFQKGKDGQPKPYLSIKFDSRAIDFMPLPKPLYEIFVHSPQMEAIHLRGGKVARGGIRWSDRRDDFRNEILGLMKAQMVKNSVIVPVGSKGGFIVKRPSPEPDKHQAEGIACYRLMMQGLLDLTDNRENGRVVPPPRVVRHDDDDPYLVVAADKGTARFSDIANSISQDYGFWLDDAFASGGSAGYDHKQMGITARGAWEAVKRHFRELGKDIQSQDFTCIGVGDMSGDVFGNGMLLSKHTRLLGAFDHRHIFCDPDPDIAESYAERLRMFGLARSSWADYDAKKISKGGGVFARSAKTIRLTPQMKKAYGVSADHLSPAELIQAMLKAEVELLYFGGIGTFVKAGDETHEEIGDRATEAVRVDAVDIRALVVGEGANLGFTQRARIEYALKGGRINTDAIDNSAGVDTSDHEVNIKILLRKLVDKGQLTTEARNKLLRSMTDDVARLVLEDNYYQTQTLSVSEERAPDLLPLHVRCMHILEKAGLLNRDLEFLPHSADIAERQRLGKGLTRPEMAVLLAYAKIWLYQQLLGSDLPDDAYLQNDLMRYFPEALQKKYPKEIRQHPLQREIIATSVTNSVTNSTGSAFVMMMADRTGEDPATVMRAYLLAREAFDLRTLWNEIDALDNLIPAKTQTHMLLVIRQVLVGAVLWFLTEMKLPSSQLAPLMATYRKGVETLAAWLEKSPDEINGRYLKTESDLIAKGTPQALARRMALMPALGTALDLTRLSEQSGGSMALVAGVFFGLGQRFGFDWLSEQSRHVAVQTPWQRDAVVALLDELTMIQRRLTTAVVGKARGKKSDSAAEKIAQWTRRHANAVERYDTLMNEWRSVGAVDIAMLTLANHQLNALLA